MKKITLKDRDYCCGCAFLEFDKKKSNPSRWLGEGYYVHQCLLFRQSLQHYLHYPLRLEECKRVNTDIKKIPHGDAIAWNCENEE